MLTEPPFSVLLSSFVRLRALTVFVERAGGPFQELNMSINSRAHVEEHLPQEAFFRYVQSISL